MAYDSDGMPGGPGGEAAPEDVQEIPLQHVKSALWSLKAAAATLESVAHLCGHEATLLPISDELRRQQAALETVIAVWRAS